MKPIKKSLTLVLAAIMLFSFCLACRHTQEAQATPAPTAEANANTPQPTAAPTEEPTPEPTEEPTPEPTEVPLMPGDLDEAFLALDNEIFLAYVTTDITTLDQRVRHPEDFGIDESTVPVTLGDFTEEANNEWVDFCVECREKLNAIDRNGLSEHLAFAYDTYCRFFDAEIESKDMFYNYEPLDMYVGMHLNMPLEFALYNFYDEKDVQNYMTLLADIPRYFGQVLAFEQERANRGWFMTEDALDEILDNLDSVAKSGKSSFLHTTFKDAMEKIDFLTEDQKKAYIKQNDELVNTAWVEGYKLLYDGLKKLRPQCREAVGAYQQGGQAYDYYLWKLRNEGNGYRSVEEALSLLETCLNRIYLEMTDCIYADIDKFREGRAITSGTLAGDEAYLKSVMYQIVPQMPDVEVQYVEIPKELQEGWSPAAYSVPPIDDYRHNTILTNPSAQTDLSTLAHEGYPGHMFQFTYQYALGTIPKFQLIIETNGYAEAWSTNSELNIARINTKFGTNYATGSFLSDYFESTLILICSLKINGQGATVKDLENYLSRWNLKSAAQGIYDLSIVMPIYYFKYALGFNELYDMTYRCKQKLGNQFDLVAFNTEYLSWGPGYFDLLNEKMDAWTAAQLGA